MKKRVRCFIALMLVWSLIPLLWGLRTSLLSNNDLYVMPLKYIGNNLDSYRHLFSGKTSILFLRALKNSFETSVLGTIVSIVITLPCAYVFSKYEFKFKKILYFLIIVILTIPFYTIMMPLYKIAVTYSLLDTQFMLIVIYVSGYSPIVFLVTKLYFDAIPSEIEEVGEIEGVSKFGRFFIATKLIVPGIVASSLIIFFNIWSSFMVPLLFSMRETKPLTVFITEFIGKSSTNYSVMTAAGIIALLIPAILVCIFNKYFIDGVITMSK